MKHFLHGHATHPDPGVAMALAAAQIDAQRREPGHADAPTLGWLYITDHCVPQAEALLADARRRWPGTQWVGASGVGISASGVEYFDEPAVSLLLGELPRDQFRVFSGARPLGDFDAHTANVHADTGTNDLAELIDDLSARTRTRYLFGGVASGRSRTVHFADAVLDGGVSGVAFGPEVAIVSRVTQGCQPVGPPRIVTAGDRNVVTTLDGAPALDALLGDVGLAGVEPRAALSRLRQILVGLGSAEDDAAQRSAFDSLSPPRGSFGADTRVRHLIGLDPGRRGIAIADVAEVGMRLTFCERHVDAARRDLVRICAEVREEVEPEELPLATALARRDAANVDALHGAGSGIAGAIYVSCAGRGGAHFGAASAELAIVRHALGDVPLAGFFAAGEIARGNLYGYTGVLTVFPSAA